MAYEDPVPEALPGLDGPATIVFEDQAVLREFQEMLASKAAATATVKSMSNKAARTSVKRAVHNSTSTSATASSSASPDLENSIRDGASQIWRKFDSSLETLQPYLDTLRDYFDGALEKARRVSNHLTTFLNDLLFRLEQILPTWFFTLLKHILLFTLKSLTFIAAQAWLGIFAYQTAYTVFNILGFLAPSQAKLFRQPIPDEDVVERMRDGQEKRNILGKKACDVSLYKGGTWIWAFSAIYLTARLLLRSQSQNYLSVMLWALAESFALFNLLPIVAAGVVRTVVPEAYLAEWLYANEEVDEQRARRVLGKAMKRREEEHGPVEPERWEVMRLGYDRRKAERKTGGLRTEWEL